MKNAYPGVKIAFIGGGNMAQSMIGGVIAAKWPGELIFVADPDKHQRHVLQTRYGVSCSEYNHIAIKNVDVILLAVKPQAMKKAVESIGPDIGGGNPLIISIAAGVLSNSILDWIGRRDIPLVRVMPNTPALVNRGVSGLFANRNCSDRHRDIAQELMSAVGKTVWVENESDIDTITAISGSGPAYFFKLMEIMMESAESAGIDAESARALVVQTAVGAAELAARRTVSPKALRLQVTSPGGTTEAAVTEMEKHHIDRVVSSGINAAITRSRALSGASEE